LFGVYVNVASSSQNPNGRGHIFENGCFEYLPIPEYRATIEEVPTYREMGFENCKFPDLHAHVDPEFQTYTYGHVRRGFGDIKNLARLEKEDFLFFYATLQQKSDWGPYVIGYFLVSEKIDCRKLSEQEIRNLKERGFENNAHLKRINPHVDFLIKGSAGSRLLNKAFPLAEKSNPRILRRSLQDRVLTAGRKKIDSGKPWFRWTLISVNAGDIVGQINNSGY
jgi:hypothetical protein